MQSNQFGLELAQHINWESLNKIGLSEIKSDTIKSTKIKRDDNGEIIG